MGLFGNLFSGNKEEKQELNWKILTSEAQLDEAIALSNEVPVILFKHSTRCSISSMAKNRLVSSWDIKEDEAVLYYLDLLAYRPISNKIANLLGVQHQSPQVIVLKDGKAHYQASHNSISVDGLRTSF